jgi:hypothetical protein
VITRDQMLQETTPSVYDAVAALRSLWLQKRGRKASRASCGCTSTERALATSMSEEHATTIGQHVRFYRRPPRRRALGRRQRRGVIHVSTWSEARQAFRADSTRRKPPQATRVPPPPPPIAMR